MQDPRDQGAKPPFPKPQQADLGREAEMSPRPDYGADSYMGHARLNERVALITGADSGIGRAVALAFAREGADVAISYRSHDGDAQETLRSVESAGRRGLTLKADLAEPEECRRLVQNAAEHFGRLDILVLNHAAQGKSVETFEELDAERIDCTLRTNVHAAFHLVRAALPHLKEGASIIVVASIQAYNPTPNILDYAVTKGALVTFTKGLALSLLPRGIRVNCVAPGPVWTPLITQSFDAKDASEFGKKSPMERPAQPKELAPAFVFLASDEASYVSGEVLGVTGGKPLG